MKMSTSNSNESVTQTEEEKTEQKQQEDETAAFVLDQTIEEHLEEESSNISNTKKQTNSLRPQDWRTHCLARPKKGRITPKYNPEPNNVLRFDKLHTVTVEEASRNWRLNQLSNPRRRRDKYNPPPSKIPAPIVKLEKNAAVMYEENPCYQKPVSAQPGEILPIQKKTKKCLKETLENMERNIPERVEHMSRNTIRVLQAQRRAFGKTLGPKFVAKMNERIEQSWNSIYNYYKKCEEAQKLEKEERRRRRIESRRAAKAAIKAEKGKGKKHKGDKKNHKGGKGGKMGSKSSSSTLTNMTQIEGILRWCTLRAQPKKRFPPAPLPPRKHGDLAKLQVRVQKLAKPKHVYIPPSKDPDILRLFKVNPKALKYVATEKIKQLSQVPENRMIKEEIPIPGSVKPDALIYEATERIKTLAIPKKRTTTAGDNEVKQDAFLVSPAALKYKPTPRILDLARPIERT